MILNKRYSRNIRSNLSFYIAATVLTAVSLLLFILFYIAGTGINQFGDEFFASQHLEDATFTTYKEINEQEIASLEESYGVVLEAEEYVNIKEGDTTIRLFGPTSKIDLYQVLEGSDIKSDEDILLSAGYAENMGIKPGDDFAFGGNTYQVCGFFLRPDYCSALCEVTDSYKNITTFVFGYVSEQVFDSLEGKSTTYKVIYNDREKELDFRRKVNDTWQIRSYTSIADNPRITYVHEQADMFEVMAWVFLFTLPLVTVCLIGIILGRKVKQEQRMIGTLMAMGYSKGKLIRHYMVLALIPGLVGGILTAFFGCIFAQPYGQLCLADYEPLPVRFHLPIPIAFAGIVIPTLIYLCRAYFTVRKLLKKDIVSLLNNSADNKKSYSKIFYKKQMPVSRKFGVRSVIGSPGRTFVVWLGIFLGAYIVAISFAFQDSIKIIGERGTENMGDFRYEYILNELGIGKPKDGEGMLVMNGEAKGSSFSIMMADEDLSLWNTRLTTGEKAELNGKWYMSSLLATIFHVKEGDELTFYESGDLEEYTIRIDGIIANDYVRFILTDKANVAELIGFQPFFYNVILSDHELELKSDKIAETIEASSTQKQVDAMLDEMDVIIYSLTLVGIIVCICALYVAVKMMIDENRVNISMLKVLGLKEKEINHMILSGNHLLLPIGIIPGIFFAVKTMELVSGVFAEMASMILPPYISGSHVILTVIIVCICYFGSLSLVKRKTGQINMVESMKDNRE